MEQVNDKGDLHRLSLVSRITYLFAVPRLYRNLTLDLSVDSHLRLLHRLGRSGSLLRVVRFLHVTNSSDQYWPLHYLHRLFCGLKNLLELRWSGILDIPWDILDVLHTRFPRLTLTLVITTTSGRLGAPQLTTCLHEMGSHMTSFSYHHETRDPLYGFKRDLLSMLICNPVLKRLDVRCKYRGIAMFPETGCIFERCQLPKLQTLIVSGLRQLFTHAELSLWGAQDGWTELRHLHTTELYFLPVFVGRVNLDELTLWPMTVNEVNDIALFFDNMSLEAPFGAPKHIVYRPPVRHSSVVPWWLLRHVPELPSFKTHHRFMRGENSVPGLSTMTAQEMSQLRRFCPLLEWLGFDIEVSRDAAGWPHDVLDETAHFEKQIQLSIHVYPASSKYVPARYRYRDCAKRFAKRRYELHPSDQGAFEIGFKFIRILPDHLQQHFNAMDHTFWSWKHGEKMSSFSNWSPYSTLEMRSTHELHRRQRRRETWMLGVGAGKYKKEIWKRKREMDRADGESRDTMAEDLQGEEVGGSGDVGGGEGSTAYATLYDLWIQ